MKSTFVKTAKIRRDLLQLKREKKIKEIWVRRNQTIKKVKIFFYYFIGLSNSGVEKRMMLQRNLNSDDITLHIKLELVTKCL